MEHGMHILIGCLIFLQTYVASDDCPVEYQRFSDQHSFCKPTNVSCEILGFPPSYKDRSEIMDLHNKYRSSLASGQESLPSGSNFLQLEWDDELAGVAQKYAEQCLYKHDCSNCRRVPNFSVGQNIAMQRLTGSNLDLQQPDWQFAVSTWFEEIEFMTEDKITSFSGPTDNNEIRHFTQIAWATTFRIGCGYVIFREADGPVKESLFRHYICNYGPAGNTDSEPVYEMGKPCGDCPSNTCCGSSCSGKSYPGLCKRTNDRAPIVKPKQPLLFFCNFRGSPDCKNYAEGDSSWIIQPTLSGNYAGVLLEGGGNSTLVFSKPVVPTSSEYCVTMLYRKGPDIDGDEMSNEANAIFIEPDTSFTFTQPLPSFRDDARHQFSTFNLSLSWEKGATVQFQFTVPSGKPKQFFHLQSVSASDGKCEKKF